MTTTRRTLLRATAGLAITSPALVSPAIVRAQGTWPNKPITIVVNFPAGGLTDGIARAFGQSVQQATGQQVLIDNKPGASGNIGAALVARAPADGYTFLHTVSSTLVQNRVTFKTLGFDPDKDLTVVSGISSGFLPVVVHKSVPVSNLKEFIEYAKTNKVNFGSWALGSSAHAFAQALNEKYKLNIEVVTYKGEAPMWQDMSAGSLQAAMGSYQAMKALLDRDAIRPIGVPGPARAPHLPNVATLVEQGYDHPAFRLHGYLVLAAPSGVPKEIVNRMAALWIEAAQSEQGRKMMDSFGLRDLPIGPAEMAADHERMKRDIIPLVQELGVKLD